MTEPTNAHVAYGFFLGKGWTPEQACGIIGNLQQESYPWLSPTVLGDRGAAFGVAQLHTDRQSELKLYCANHTLDYRTLEAQLAFIHWDMTEGDNRGVGKALKAALTVLAATAAFEGYERPTGYSMKDPTLASGWLHRLANAEALYAEMK